MRIIDYQETLRLEPGYAATVGCFDGVHRGHLFLIEQLREAASAAQLLTMAVTFNRQPRQVFQPGWEPQLLATLDEKCQLLEEAGIDVTVVIDFDRQMADLSAHDFMLHVLQQRLGVRLLLTGYDNHFGHRSAQNADEGYDDYAAYGLQMGIGVVQARPLIVGGSGISSSRVRMLLQEGRISEANACLGRPYSFSGSVVGGEHVGRQLGFPTANVQPGNRLKLMPAPGVYAVTVQTGGHSYGGMMNIGTRPTFGQHDQTQEVHVFDFAGNLYGQQLTVSFIDRLRTEQRFDSPTQLVEQLRQDAQAARQRLQM